MKNNNRNLLLCISICFLAETSTLKLVSSKKKDTGNLTGKNISIKYCSICFYFLQHISLLPRFYVSQHHSQLSSISIPCFGFGCGVFCSVLFFQFPLATLP